LLGRGLGVLEGHRAIGWLHIYTHVSAGKTNQCGGHKYLAEGCRSFVEGSLEEGRHHPRHIHMAAARVDRSDSAAVAPWMILAMLRSLVVLL
jgi:hypothetical protein